MNKTGNILFINTFKEECGIHQYGLNIFKALTLHKENLEFNYTYATPKSLVEFRNLLSQGDYKAVIVNYVSIIFPWLNSFNKSEFPNTKFIDIIHEQTKQHHKTFFSNYFFDFSFFASPLAQVEAGLFKLPRLIPEITSNVFKEPTHITVGSFGFGIMDRGWLQTIDRVQEEFDQANIVFHMPFNTVVDPGGNYHAKHTAAACRTRPLKPGVTLSIEHGFLSTEDMVSWLSRNTINLFLYQEKTPKGISSTIDFALAANRPIGISSSPMFRHLVEVEPAINVEKNTLKSIIERGPSILDKYREDWNSKTFTAYLDTQLKLNIL